MTVFRRRDANLTEATDPEVVSVAETTYTYFSTFRITPARGQVYVAAHDVQGAPLVTVISHRLWQRRFAGDAGVIGKTVQIDGETATIVGVLSRALDENGSPDLWLPARLDPVEPPSGDFRWLVSTRLKPAIGPGAAEAELVPLMSRLLSGLQAQEYRAFLTEGRYRVLRRGAGVGLGSQGLQRETGAAAAAGGGARSWVLRLLVVVADPGLVCGRCRACHPPQAGEADGVAQAVAGQSLECAAVAGWDGHEVVHAEPGMGPGEE